MKKHTSSFSEYFSSSFQEIAALKGAEKRNAETLLRTLDEWRSVETSYSKKILDAAAMLTAIDKEQTGMYCLYQHLQETLVVLATQSRNLALKIEDDIVIELKELTRKLNTELDVSVDAEKYSRKAVMAKKVLTDKAYVQYMSSKRTMEDNQILNVVVTGGCDSNLQKRLKQTQKTLQAEKQFKLMEFKYRESVAEYNECLATHSTVVANILHKFEQQELELIRSSHQSVLKAHLHLSTKLKTITHQLDRISELATQFSYNECLQATAEKFAGTPQSDLTSITFQASCNFISETIRSMSEKSIDQLIDKCKNKQIKQSIEKATRSRDMLEEVEDEALRHFLKVFTVVLTGEEINKLEDIKMLLASADNRAYFVACLQQYRLIGKFVMEQKTIHNLQKMTMVFLDECYDKRDAYLAKQVMVLLFTYFYVVESDPDKEKVYLQSLVRNHPIWEQQDFWDSALLMCIYEQRRNLINQNIQEKEHEIQSQRNAIFNQLMCIPHNMVLFGIEEKQAKAFANKYVKLFNLTSRLKDIERNIQSASGNDNISKKQSLQSTKSEYPRSAIRSAESVPMPTMHTTRSLKES